MNLSCHSHFIDIFHIHTHSMLQWFLPLAIEMMFRWIKCFFSFVVLNEFSYFYLSCSNIFICPVSDNGNQDEIETFHKNKIIRLELWIPTMNEIRNSTNFEILKHSSNFTCLSKYRIQNQSSSIYMHMNEVTKNVPACRRQKHS